VRIKCVAYFQVVEPDAADADEPRLLSGRDRLIRAAPPGKQALPGLSSARPELIAQGLPRGLGRLESGGSTGLPPADGCLVDRVTVGCSLVDAERRPPRTRRTPVAMAASGGPVSLPLSHAGQPALRMIECCCRSWVRLPGWKAIHVAILLRRRQLPSRIRPG